MNWKNRKGLKEAINDTVTKGWLWGYIGGVLISQIIDFESTSHLFGSIMIWFIGVLFVEMFYKSKHENSV